MEYYANAPQIVEPDDKPVREKRDRADRKRQRGEAQHGGVVQPEEGYKRLFINLGKRDNVYAREIIGLVNKYVKGSVEIGRIDLTANCSFFEVPEEVARSVVKAFKNASMKGRRIVVDDAEATGTKHSHSRGGDYSQGEAYGRGKQQRTKGKNRHAREDSPADKPDNGKKYRKDDWKQFFK